MSSAPLPNHGIQPTASGRGLMPALAIQGGEMEWKAFETLARERMSQHLGVTLLERQLPGVSKKFDMVSADGTVVGDTKYLTPLHGQRLPPPKFMKIAGQVWLLEQIAARRRFLVFGNQRRVSEWWPREVWWPRR